MDQVKTKVNGQVFVVTKGGGSVKLGLLGIHVVGQREFPAIAKRVLQQADTSQANEDLLKGLAGEIQGLIGKVHPSYATTLKQIEQSVLERLAAEARKNLPESMLFSLLPPVATQTDADGLFTIEASRTDWIVARSQRLTGDTTERYLWVLPVGEVKKKLLVSNDRMLDADELIPTLRKISPVESKPVAESSLALWASEQRTASQVALERALAQAKAAQERAIAEAKAKAEAEERERQRLAAEAKAAPERAIAEAKAKRLDWTGSALRRAGMKENTITRTLTQGGNVVAWGDNEKGQTTVPAGLSGVVAIAAGGSHTVALKSDGTLVAWGRNSDGQTTVPAGLSGVVAIAAGGAHTVALKSDGTVVAWGGNDRGQTTVPAGLSGVVAIAAGGAHTVALKSDGTVVAWGGNDRGQATVPAGLSGVVAIAAGDGHTVALKSDGTVVAEGKNISGQATVPAGLSGVVAIAAGGLHTVALKSDGTVVAWGGSSATVMPAGLSGVVAIAAGANHTVALKLD